MLGSAVSAKAASVAALISSWICGDKKWWPSGLCCRVASASMFLGCLGLVGEYLFKLHPLLQFLLPSPPSIRAMITILEVVKLIRLKQGGAAGEVVDQCG